MKILTIGDLHGRYNSLVDGFKKFVNEDYDVVVLMSDFLDSFTASDQDCIKCLQTAIDFKKAFTSKVILLNANHEMHYLHYPNYRCSGFRPSYQIVAQTILKENEDLFQYYYFNNGYLFSHAGISNAWLNQVKQTFKYYDKKNTLFELLDKLPQTQQGLDLLNQCGEERGGLKYDHSGLTWLGKEKLITDAYFDDLIKFQIVGHTYVEEITKIGNLYFTDCLGNKKEFLTLNI